MKLSLRFAVLERDGFQCVYCGVGAMLRLHIDHVRPQCLGGADDYYNLVTACEDCNLGKSGCELSPASLRHIRAHIRSAALRRNIELISQIPDVKRLIPSDRLGDFADILEDPFVHRGETWMSCLREQLEEFQRSADKLPRLPIEAELVS